MVAAFGLVSWVIEGNGVITESLLIITGTMGAGKTSALGEASDILARRQIAHCAIDLDTFGIGYLPAVADMRGMMYRNLRCVCTNYSALEYPDSLVTCKRDPQQSGRWKPEGSCEAYIPVCSDVYGDSAATVMCLAYPASKMSGTNFQAAAFSVNRLQQAKTEAECLRVAEPPPHWKPSHAENINGVKFNVTHTDGVATGNLIDGYVYRAFHRNNCYELDIRISFSCATELNTVIIRNATHITPILISAPIHFLS
jgi:hypothetical protein